MVDVEQVLESDAPSSLIDQLGDALLELNAHNDTSEDRVQWEEIEEHFRNLETTLRKNFEELEAKEKKFADAEEAAEAEPEHAPRLLRAPRIHGHPVIALFLIGCAADPEHQPLCQNCHQRHRRCQLQLHALSLSLPDYSPRSTKKAWEISLFPAQPMAASVDCIVNRTLINIHEWWQREGHP